MALNRPAFSQGEYDCNESEDCKLEWVNDGGFHSNNQNFDNGFWHGLGAWTYLQITLDKFYAVKTVIFQSR